MSNNHGFAPNQKFGEYTLIKKLGEGGFGQVWLGKKEGEFFAIKFPYKDQADWELIAQEIGLWKLCGNHPNIIPLLDARIINRQIGIISEYVSDGSLEDLLIWKNKLSFEAAVQTTIGILKGLQHLHENSIIHCDLKPANILLQDGVPRLTDFGISNVKKTSLTNDMQDKRNPGTPPYMAPEIIKGKKAKETSDIWAVGVNLYRMVCGNLPFPQNNLEILIYAITKGDYEALPENIPFEFHKVIEIALRKNPNDRYQSANEMRQDLQDFLINFTQKETFPAIESPSSENSAANFKYELPPTKPSPTVSPNTLFESPIIQTPEDITSEKSKLETIDDATDISQLQSRISTVNLLNENRENLLTDDQQDSVTDEPATEIIAENESLRTETKIGNETQNISSITTDEKDTKEPNRTERTDLLEKAEKLNRKAEKLGIDVIALSGLNEKSIEDIELIVRHFEDKILETEKNQQKKSTHLLERVRKLEQKASDLKVPLPDKLNLTETLVADFERQVAEAEKKNQENLESLLKRVNEIESRAVFLKVPLPNKSNLTEKIVSDFEKRVAEAGKNWNRKENIRIIKLLLITPFFLSGIPFILWLFPPIRSLIPLNIWLLPLLTLVIWRAKTAAEAVIADISDFPLRFVPINVFYILIILVLFGVNYYINPEKTKNIYYDSIAILGFKKGKINKDITITVPAVLPQNTSNPSSISNTDIQINVNSNSNIQSNIQTKNSNTLTNASNQPSLQEKSENFLVERSIRAEFFLRELYFVNIEVSTDLITLSGSAIDWNSRNIANNIAKEKGKGRMVLNLIEIKSIKTNKIPSNSNRP